MSRGIILPFGGVTPKIAASVWLAPNCTITGDVEIADEASIWFGVVIRGDVNEIRIGSRSNIQDNSVIHATKGGHGTYIGNHVTVGHAAILHACTLEDESFIGMGSIVMDGVVVEARAMIAAGAVVTPNKRVPSGELWGGNPARKLRDISEVEQAGLQNIADRYLDYAKGYGLK
ncbi:MAG: gamma carbonic anhydrase family protein [Candidatus Symbiobacter sp.]|nr:gamma carbonic anhydrase family protein [Candidatus Symbiobacter sp.]